MIGDMETRSATGKESAMNASLRELAHREQDGLEVTLFWDARSNDVSIEVVDQRDESSFRLPVAGHRALDAFHHPYAYALATNAASDIGSAKSAQVTS
jgi:hypothetical protein